MLNYHTSNQDRTITAKNFFTRQLLFIHIILFCRRLVKECFFNILKTFVTLSIFLRNCLNLVNFIVIGIFINKNTYIIPTNAYMTYRSVKDTDNVSRHFFFLLKVHT